MHHISCGSVGTLVLASPASRLVSLAQVAAGLVWGAATDQDAVMLFFLACVAIAGILGARTVHPRVFMIQSLLALVGVALLAATA